MIVAIIIVLVIIAGMLGGNSVIRLLGSLLEKAGIKMNDFDGIGSKWIDKLRMNLDLIDEPTEPTVPTGNGAEGLQNFGQQLAQVFLPMGANQTFSNLFKDFGGSK